MLGVPTPSSSVRIPQSIGSSSSSEGGCKFGSDRFGIGLACREAVDSVCAGRTLKASDVKGNVTVATVIHISLRQ